MKIALLGYGKEGQAAEKYFKTHFNAECDIFENFTYDEIRQRDYSSFDYILRSPSVPPLNLPNESSLTKYFFSHCPCPIIGVTGTKGKGTTCSLIKSVLDALGKDTYLVGNIGTPSIEILDSLKPTSVVVYEMSSFQLWDLKKSPHIAVVLRIEPDHLNVHRDFSDYVNAKSHIAEYQTSKDSIVYFKNNPHSVEIAAKSPAKHRFPYPSEYNPPKLAELLNSLKVPGAHNKENAKAALLAVAAFLNISLDELIDSHFSKIQTAFSNFQGLPHHLEFIRNLNNVDYYDDSFSASSPSLEVAIKSFPGQKIILISGGKDRGLDLTPHKNAIFNSDNIEKAILIGETRYNLSADQDRKKFILKDTLKDAVITARKIAEAAAKTSDKPAVVLLSPGAASFDMFKDFYDRGEKFQKYVKELK